MEKKAGLRGDDFLATQVKFQLIRLTQFPHNIWKNKQSKDVTFFQGKENSSGKNIGSRKLVSLVSISMRTFFF